MKGRDVFGQISLKILAYIFCFIGFVIRPIVESLRRLLKFRLKGYPDSFSQCYCFYENCLLIGDVFDLWTFAHSLITLIISSVIFRFTHNPEISFIGGFTIMLLYEVFIDGYGYEDYAFSINDIVANLIGGIIFIFIYFMIGG